MKPPAWLRLEGAAVFALSLFLYFRADGGWAMLILLLLVPDLSMLGYLGGERPGAAVYNLVHSYLLPLLLIGIALLAAQPIVVLCGLIWVAHIGMDRMLGYGLKLETGFRHTHLGSIGRGGPED